MNKPPATLLIAVLVVGMFFSSVCFSDAPKFVASSYSDRYHLSTCKIAQKIPAEDLVIFKTPEEAFAADLVPCKKCNPPAPKGMGSKEKYNFSRKTADDTDQES